MSPRPLFLAWILSCVAFACPAVATADTAPDLVAPPAVESPAPEIKFRPLFGLGPMATPAGFGLDLQAGFRTRQLLLRASLGFSTASSPTPLTPFVTWGVHADYLFPSSGASALFAGVGFGGMVWGGGIIDNEAGNERHVIPEVGVVLGHNRWLGRIVADVQVPIPVESELHPDRPGTRPSVLFSLIASL